MAKSHPNRRRSSSPSQQNSTPPSHSSINELEHESHDNTADMNSLLATPQPFRLLIISLGNPGKEYAHTLHSAGHSLLSALAISLTLPPLKIGSLSKAPDGNFTLLQSPAFMNDSGPAVMKAWRQFQRSCREKGESCKLIVVHDELELPVGQVGVKDGGSSPKGHNGLKSVKKVLSVGGKEGWVRIGVGVGRPENRASDVVSAWVLRKMTAIERKGVEECVGRVEGELRRILQER